MKTKNAKNVALLLHDTRCLMENNDIERCETIEHYLNSDFVTYENIGLDNDEGYVPPITDYKNTILDAILKEFEDYFPDRDLKSFDVLDPMNMPLPNGEASTRTYGITKIADVSDLFQIPDKDELIKQWQELLLSVVQSDNYCQITTVKTGVSTFWAQLFKWPEIVWGENIKWLVQTILSLLISSAEAERGFSFLKYVRGSRRSRAR